MSAPLEKRSFSIKDIVYIVTIVIGIAANYYTMNDRVGDLEDNDGKQDIKISKVEEGSKAYASLPKDVAKMQLDIAKNAKITNAIYYGLLSKGIIKPPQ